MIRTNKNLWKQQGLTLIEIVITVSILSALLLISIPLFTNSSQTNIIQNELRQFEQDVRFVQQMALTESKTMEIRFLTPTYYAILDRRTGTYVKRRHFEAIRHVSYSQVEWLRFNRHGRIQQGGMVRFLFEKRGETLDQIYLFRPGSRTYRVED